MTQMAIDPTGNQSIYKIIQLQNDPPIRLPTYLTPCRCLAFVRLVDVKVDQQLRCIPESCKSLAFQCLVLLE